MVEIKHIVPPQNGLYEFISQTHTSYGSVRRKIIEMVACWVFVFENVITYNFQIEIYA